MGNEAADMPIRDAGIASWSFTHDATMQGLTSLEKSGLGQQPHSMTKSSA